MNNFWELASFELKKILFKKSVILAIILALATIVFSSFSMIIGGNSQSNYNTKRLSNYESMLLDKGYEKELEGRKLDGKLILEASAAYKKVDISSTIGKYTDTSEYQNYARKYMSVFHIVDAAYAKPSKSFDVVDFQNITEEMANNYYTYREKQYIANLTNNPFFSDSDIKKIMSLDTEVEKPFTMYYTDGYERFLVLSITTSLMALLVLSFSLSPIFSNEYAMGTDALILTTKNGKNTLIQAKIFSSLVFTFSLMLLFNLVVYFSSMAIYGFDGGIAQIQLMIPALTYNFTMIETVILIIITSLFAAFLHTSLCLFVSSLSNNSIVPMTITTVLLILGMFNGPSIEFFVKLKCFLPISMGSFWDMTTQYVFNIFSLQIMLYQAVCIVALIVGTLLLAGSYRNFKTHQVF